MWCRVGEEAGLAVGHHGGFLVSRGGIEGQAVGVGADGVDDQREGGPQHRRPGAGAAPAAYGAHTKLDDQVHDVDSGCEDDEILAGGDDGGHLVTPGA